MAITTDMGKMCFELYDETPKHRDNYVKLLRAHYFDGLLFHRVIPKFMVQSGDPDSKTAKAGQLLGDGGLPYTIPAEIMPEKYFHQKGALAAARDDRPDKASSSTQFYIVTGKTFTDADLDRTEKRTGYTIPEEHRRIYKTIGGAPHLDNNYTVFGQCIKGQEIAIRIGDVPRDKNDRPLKDIHIKKARVLKKCLFWWW